MAEAIPGHIHCPSCRRQWIGVASERCPFCTLAAVEALQTKLVVMSRSESGQEDPMYLAGLKSAVASLHQALAGDLPQVPYCGAPGCSRIATWNNGTYQACDAHVGTAPPSPVGAYQSIKDPSHAWRNS